MKKVSQSTLKTPPVNPDDFHTNATIAELIEIKFF